MPDLLTPLIVLLAIAWIIFSATRMHWHPFFSLLTATLAMALAAGLPVADTPGLLAEGFGATLAHIGWVVVLGSVLGVFLEKSGAATTLALAVLRLAGKKRTEIGMSLLGGIVGIPVFCDSGFILLSGLNGEVARRSGKSAGGLALGLAGGLYASHTLVIPTPGPIAAAGNLGLGDDLGWVLLLGLPTALVASLTAAACARFLGRELPASALPTSDKTVPAPKTPSLFRALAPLAAPLVLIALGPILKSLANPAALNWVALFSSPLVALTLGLGLAWLLLGQERKAVKEWFAEGIGQSGPILALTGAGGAFGAVLKKLLSSDSLAGVIETLSPDLVGLVVIAFSAGAFLKTAQGSSTAALVIGSALLAPLIQGASWTEDIHSALVVVSLGAGALTVSHANDSYFWVVTQFTGMDLKTGLRTFTLTTLGMGLASLAFCLLLAAMIALLK